MTALSIALLTAKDLFRRRILVVLALFGIIMILLSFPLRELTVGQWQRLITDVGLGAMELTLTLIAIFLGSTLIAGDLERRTLYPLISKPLSRGTFVVGKFLGLCLVLLLLSGAMGLGLELVLAAARQDLFVGLNAIAMTGIFVTSVVVSAVSVLFSAFTTSTLAAIFCLSLTIVGHLISNLVYFASKAESAFGSGMVFVARTLPNLELVNFKDFAAHQAALPLDDVWQHVGYEFLYATLLVALGTIIFARRDLK